MKLMRNREVFQENVITLLIVIVSTVVFWPLLDVYALYFILIGFILIAVHYYFQLGRYRRIADMSMDLNKILHGNVPTISKSYEGELSILNDEIAKMVLKMNEQTDLLSKEKIRLTDAIADIFHQMRTPLTAINLSLSLLNDPMLSDEKRLFYRRDMKKQLEKLQWLIETLLKMSKIDAKTAVFHRNKVNIHQLIRKSIQPFVISAELKNQQIINTCRDESAFIDEQWTIEAISNLIKNAVEHTPNNGSIEISASENPLFTEIVIRDNGEGIAEEDIPFMFERFYKGINAKPESVGIGLAFARMIITAQEGTITVKNNPDRGACFVIRFYKQIV